MSEQAERYAYEPHDTPASNFEPTRDCICTTLVIEGETYNAVSPSCHVHGSISRWVPRNADAVSRRGRKTPHE